MRRRDESGDAGEHTGKKRGARALFPFLFSRELLFVGSEHPEREKRQHGRAAQRSRKRSAGQEEERKYEHRRAAVKRRYRKIAADERVLYYEIFDNGVQSG